MGRGRAAREGGGAGAPGPPAAAGRSQRRPWGPQCSARRAPAAGGPGRGVMASATRIRRREDRDTIGSNAQGPVDAAAGARPPAAAPRARPGSAAAGSPGSPQEEDGLDTVDANLVLGLSAESMDYYR
ncbi:unnamed protein product [Prorocentrum cordatum]|uniref:Uncharacterized protein n=1 Tax=Prorocentrum cordatum TaxID=2364126 RepID=A0ABN9UIM8_9DINO|nr:unnamed protein product [Polarella glacialis]